MEKNLKKIALFGLAAGLSCLSAQEVQPAQETQVDSSKEISMGKCGDSPRPDDCGGRGTCAAKGQCKLGRDKASCSTKDSCRANCGCGMNTTEEKPTCKKVEVKRKGAAKQAMED